MGVFLNHSLWLALGCWEQSHPSTPINASRILSPPVPAQRFDTGVNFQQKKYEKIESHVNSLSQEWSILLFILFDCMYLIVSYDSVQCDAIFTRIFIILIAYLLRLHIQSYLTLIIFTLPSLLPLLWLRTSGKDFISKSAIILNTKRSVLFDM